MVTVGMNYQVIPEKDAEFIAVFSKVLQVIADTPGHKDTHLYRDVYREHDYLVVSEWTDETAFRAFIASDRFRNVANWGRENVLAARPTHEVYGSSKSIDSEPAAAPDKSRCPMHRA
jgi:heme-degrading monooxygenase HmoA